MRHLICLFTLVLAACGGSTPGSSDNHDDEPSVAQCVSEEDCYSGCFGYDTAVCSSKGVCFCNDIREDRGCDLDEECVEACDGYDSHSCSGGKCVCSDPPAVQCLGNSDCAYECAGYDIHQCYAGLCACYTENEVCPAISRGDFVKWLYLHMGFDSCPNIDLNASCSDIPDGSFLSCVWSELEEAGIIGIYGSGECRPDNVMNRAELTKIVVSAIDGLADYEAPASPTFDDVPVAAWFYDYVEAAVQLGLTSGYVDDYGNLTGLFGPGDLADMCFADSVLWNATGLWPPIGDPVLPSGLVVSLNNDTPPSTTLPKSATGVQLVSFDFTAPAGSDVALSNLVVTRGGVGQASDWDALYLYDGNVRVTDGRTINSATNTMTFPLSVLASAGTTKTLTLMGNVSASAGLSNQHYFYIASAADTTSNATAVTGDFPVASNTFTISSVVVNWVTISKGSVLPDPHLYWVDQEVGNFDLEMGADNDGALHKIRLIQGGTLSLGHLDNFRLYRGTDLLPSTVRVGGYTVTFTLNSPYIIPAGQSKKFTVVADVVSGRSTDTIQLYLEQYYDLLVIDQQYGFGASVSNVSLTSAETQILGLEGPTVTITDNGPTAATVSPGASDVVVQNISVTSFADLTVRDTRLEVRVYDGSDQLVGTADEGAYALLKMLRIVDLDTGNTLQGPMTTVAHGDRQESAGEVWYTKVLTEDYELTGGDSRHLGIRVDVDVTFPSGYSFDVVFSLVPVGGGDSYVKDLSANEILPASSIIGDPLMSNGVTVQ